jgi:hypothetical protein
MRPEAAFQLRQICRLCRDAGWRRLPARTIDDGTAALPCRSCTEPARVSEASGGDHPGASRAGAGRDLTLSPTRSRLRSGPRAPAHGLSVIASVNNTRSSPNRSRSSGARRQNSSRCGCARTLHGRTDRRVRALGSAGRIRTRRTSQTAAHGTTGRSTCSSGRKVWVRERLDPAELTADRAVAAYAAWTAAGRGTARSSCRAETPG